MRLNELRREELAQFDDAALEDHGAHSGALGGCRYVYTGNRNGMEHPKVNVSQLRLGLRELANIDFQRRVWTGQGSPSEMSSFTEAVETVFTDSGLEPDLGFGRPVFGPEVDAELLVLDASLRRIASGRTQQEIIDDPLMAHVRLRAATVLGLLPATDQ